MEAAAKVLGYGAVKYADLKGNRTTNYIFSYERMLDPKGNTAIYLMYAGARIASILRKAAVDTDALVASGAALELGHEAELCLGRHLLRFQDAVEKVPPAHTNKHSHSLAQYTPRASLPSRRRSRS